MSDLMFYGVLRMPYELAMGNEISRLQFYGRAKEAADRIEVADARIADLERDTAAQAGQILLLADQVRSAQAFGEDAASKLADAEARTLKAAEAMQWQLIETAPKDGRTLLLGAENSRGNWRTMRGQWFSAEVIADEWEDPEDAEAGWYETAVEPDVPNCWSITPTHWMHFPKAPT